MKTQCTVTIFDQDGNDLELTMRAHREVCPRCEGEGQHDHPAFDNGITGEEWSSWDSEEREDYMQGAYDVTCEQCEGLRVVLVPDEDDPNFPAYARHCEEVARYEAECRAERRMGA